MEKLSDEGPTLETVGFTVPIDSTPTLSYISIYTIDNSLKLLWHSGKNKFILVCCTIQGWPEFVKYVSFFPPLLYQLSEKDSHNEELLREISNLKRKLARTSGEMNDMKLLLEKSQSRNAELEKKQRR